MLPEVTFIQYINDIRDAEDKINDLYKMGLDITESDLTLSDQCVNLLQIVMEDKEEIIPYFCWELDFGRDKMAKDCITDTDTGETYSLCNSHDVYEYIKNNRPHKSRAKETETCHEQEEKRKCSNSVTYWL